ncbi:YCF48-related protein [Fluviicola sp.]|uniref:T9SS type A sorting domain-containing protein n=1 Tax=Fluviicola sp. TaxID=1917219 RepID=UPI0031D09962
MNKTLLFLSGLLLTCTVSAQPFVPQNSGLSSSSVLSSIDFVNDDIGMAVSYDGEIVKTINGGTNWVSQNSGTSTALRDVVMIDAQTAVAVGYNGLIIRTSNGGSAWTPIASGTTQNLVSVILNNSVLYISGVDGEVLKSVNSGLTWTTLTVGNGSNPKTVYFTSATTGYVGCEYGEIYKTINGGSSWTQQTTGLEGLSGNYQLIGMYFTDANNGIVVGGNAQTGDGVILRTVNAGTIWSSQFLANNYMGSVDFLNSTTGFISGGSISGNTSTILKTTDGGATWNVQSTSSSRQVGAAFPSQTAGYTCGLNGTILKISNIALGTDELAPEIKLDVFPNPGNGQFNLFVAEEMVTDNTLVEVLNLNGEVVLEQEYRTNVDISNLVNGIYFIRVRNKTFSVAKKVIKE